MEIVVNEPLDPETHCILCGESLAEHDEQACQAKMQAWRPLGLPYLGDKGDPRG